MTIQVVSNQVGESRDYAARAVVGRLHVMGHFEHGISVRVPVYRFLTLYQGEGREAIPVEFVRPAPVIPGEHDETFLDFDQLKEGDIVVDPGLIYRRCLWFDNLMAAHMKALQTFKPKTIMVAEKDDAPPVDIGTIDATTDQVTKQ
jgi:hypothetical protein